MIAKTFEIRDRKTFIPVLAIQLMPTCEADRYLLSRANYGHYGGAQSRHTILVKLEGTRAEYDPNRWGDSRTMRTAHSFIGEHFDELESGMAIDVEYILHETEKPKITERLEDEFLKKGEKIPQPQQDHV